MLSQSQKVTSNLSALQGFFGNRVGKDVFMYSIARNPRRDTQEVMQVWARRSGAGPGWKFLTGRTADVERLRTGLGFGSTDPHQDADPAVAVALLRLGVEPQMRWAHCQSQALPRMLAHSILTDFGAGPVDPSSALYVRFTESESNYRPIWNCKLLLAGLN